MGKRRRARGAQRSTLVWQSERNGVYVTDLEGGVSRLLARPDGGVLAVAASAELQAWREGDRLTVHTAAGPTSWSAPSAFPSIAARGAWLAWVDGTTLHLRSLDAGARTYGFPDGGAIAVSSSGCFVDVLVRSSMARQWAYRLSLP
jgi:hypothetical protein